MTDQPWTGRRLHVLGIGGAGMSAYALAARALGATVTGSDRSSSPYLDRVRAAGIDVAVGHAAANVPAGDVEVFASTAVPADNPEVVAARERGLAVRPREDLLAELTGLRRTIAVAGAHGKTTTSAMIAHVLHARGLQPGYLIGGVVRSTGANGAWGAGEWLVVEADESDRSMLRLHVEVAVVTNVELDHHATYGSLDELRECFRAFLRGAPRAIVWDRPDLLALREPGAAVVGYDVAEGAAALTAGGSRFGWRGEEVAIAVPGIHNARNAVAALEACVMAGVAPADAVRAIGSFTGAGRRFERLGSTAWGALVVDDYAHHPTEVAATIAAARTLGEGRRVVAIFQPHLYSRTQALAREFGAALRGADEIVLLDVYEARERAEDFPGVSSQLVMWATDDRAHWWRHPDRAPGLLEELSGSGDVLLFMGAGDIDRLARSYVG